MARHRLSASRHRSSTTRHRSPFSSNRRAGLTALTAVLAVVATFMAVAGGLFAPSSATAGSVLKRNPCAGTKVASACRTVTATATVTSTQTVTATTTTTATVAGPTATVTTTVGAAAPTSTTAVPVPTATVTASPSTAPTSSATSDPLPTAPERRIGIYMSGNNSGLDSYTSGWATKPNIASFYVPWGSGVPTLMKTYAGQGRAIQVELATKNSSGYKLWSDIAAGAQDTAIVSFIKALDALGTPVMLSLDNEPDAKATSGTGEVAPNQTAAQYVAAANHVADLIHANSKHVESMVWLAGFKGVGDHRVLPASALQA